jgi:hypothetical protein
VNLAAFIEAIITENVEHRAVVECQREAVRLGLYLNNAPLKQLVKVKRRFWLGLAIVWMWFPVLVDVFDTALDRDLAAIYEPKLKPVWIKTNLPDLLTDKKLQIGRRWKGMHSRWCVLRDGRFAASSG